MIRPRGSRAKNKLPGDAPARGIAMRFYKDGQLRDAARPLLRELFEEEVLKDEATKCWLWLGSTDQRAGYGQTSLLGRWLPAHRVSYFLFVGDIPDNLHVCHKCDTPPCVNPDHLWLGSHADNMHDKLVKGRQRGRHNTGNNPFTHYPQGHEYSAENTYSYQNRRYCKSCHKVYAQNYQARDASPTPRAYCGNGHEFTVTNTYWFRGHQHCRECHKKLSLDWYYRNNHSARATGPALE